MLTIPPDGKEPSRPTVLGEPNGETPVLVYATGMFKSLRKGEERWVTGTDAAKGIEGGVLMPLDSNPLALTEEEREVRNEAPPAAAVATADDIPTATDVDVALAAMSKPQLVKLAQKLSLEGRSAMDKSELYEHLRHHPEVADHLH